MKRLGSTLGCIIGGAILLTQLCSLLCFTLATLACSTLKSAQQRKRTVYRFRQALKRQGVPEELIKRMAKRYGKDMDWLDWLKFLRR